MAQDKGCETKGELDPNLAHLLVLGRVAANLSHEISNPLLVQVGYITKLKKLLASQSQDYEAMTQSLLKIEAMTDRIRSMVKALARMGREQIDLEWERVRLQSLLADSFTLLESKFKKAQIAISLSVEPADLTINCPPVQLSQVVVNLLANAYDAIEKQEDPWVQVRGYQNGDGSVIDIDDSGEPIPREIAERMFERGFTTKCRSQGMGLGLHLSLELLKLFSGRLTHHSLEAGNRFRIEIPHRHES